MMPIEADTTNASGPPYALLRWIGLVVALGVLAYGGWYFANKFRSGLSDHMLAKAGTFIRQGRNGDAMLCLESALRLNPANVTAWRQIAIMHAARQNSSGVLDAYIGLYKATQANGIKMGDLLSLEDRRAWILGALHENNTMVAKRLADSIGRRSGNNALPHLVLAECLSLIGDLDAAVVELRDGSAVNPIFTKPLSLSDLLDSDSTRSKEATEFFTLLSDTQKRLGNRGYEAAFFGLKTSLVPSDRILGWAKRLADNPAAPLRMRLFAVRLVSSITGSPMSLDFLYPERPEELSEQDRRLLGEEFLKTGSPEKTLFLIDRVQALKSQSFFKLRLAALLATNRRAEALEALERLTNPLSTNETTFETFKIQTDFELDGRVPPGVKLAPIHPANAVELMSYGLFLAETRQEDRMAELIRGFPKDSGEGGSFKKNVLAQVRDRGDLRAAIAFQNATLVALQPERPAEDFSDREIFLALAGNPVDLAGLEALRRDQPDSIPLRISYAFALLSSGQKEAAIEALRVGANQIDIHALGPHQKVAVAAILFANGLSAPALEVAKLALLEKLFPAEVEKLTPVFQQAANPS